MLSRDERSATRMNSPQIEERLIRIFESARQSPGAPYERDRFLAYLTRPPATSGRRVADTFAGRRRFVRFMDAVQMEFGICFTAEDWEKGFQLAKLVEEVEAKLSRPDQQRRFAETRATKARARQNGTIQFSVISGLILSLLALQGPTLFQLPVAIVWVTMTIATVTISVRDYSYARSLLSRMGRA